MIQTVSLETARLLKEKKCTKCLVVKPIAQFSKYLKAGKFMCTQSKCRTCCAIQTKEFQKKNPIKKKSYDDNYKKTPAGRITVKKGTVNYRKKFPEKIKATNAVGNAIRYGKLKKKPCEKCGEVKVHAHHEDYSKPLEIVWLCHKCHVALHKLKRENLLPLKESRKV